VKSLASIYEERRKEITASLVVTRKRGVDCTEAQSAFVAREQCLQAAEGEISAAFARVRALLSQRETQLLEEARKRMEASPGEVKRHNRGESLLQELADHALRIEELLKRQPIELVSNFEEVCSLYSSFIFCVKLAGSLTFPAFLLLVQESLRQIAPGGK